MFTEIVGLIAGVGAFVNVNKAFKAVGGNTTCIELIGGAALGLAAGVTAVKTCNKLTEVVKDVINGVREDVDAQTSDKEDEKDVEDVKDDEPEVLKKLFVDMFGTEYYVSTDGKIHKLKEVKNERADKT